MKKDEITRVRLLSLAVLMALSLFILLVLNSSTNASSLALSGCNTVIPCATASSLTGEKTSDLLLPLGLSG